MRSRVAIRGANEELGRRLAEPIPNGERFSRTNVEPGAGELNVLPTTINYLLAIFAQSI